MEHLDFLIDKSDTLFFYPSFEYYSESMLTFFTHGKGVLQMSNKIYPIACGDTIFLPEYRPYSLRSACDSQLAGLNIYFNYSKQLSLFFSIPEFSDVTAFLFRYPNGFKIPEQQGNKVEEKLLSIKRNKGLRLLIDFLELFLDLINCNSIVPLVEEKNGVGLFEEDRIRKVVNYIYQNFNATIRLEDVAEIANLTKESFCRYFKQHTGHTLISFINEVRIAEACKMLISQQQSILISTIAYNSGFKNISHFNKTFKEVMGDSPHNYLRKNGIDHNKK